jgi:DNA-binding protein H-NS
MNAWMEAAIVRATIVLCHTGETIAAITEQNLEQAEQLQSHKELARLGGARAMAQVERELKPLTDLFAKHGITTADLETVEKATSGEDRKQAVRALSSKVTDRAGLASEIMALHHKALTKGAKVEEAASTIKSVQVDGDRATAIISATRPGMQSMEVPMQLRRTASGWKIDNTSFYR